MTDLEAGAALLALADQVERAEGASRKLDMLIALHMGRSSFRDYTASVDAAMTLIPPDFRLSQMGEWDATPLRAAGPFLAILIRAGEGDSLHSAFEARCNHARSLAIALTSAAIRGHAATKQGEPA